jgi:molybdenum cofactor cytidylyltransferase
MIAALVLAAGGSTRMGRPKPLLPWGGGTLIEAALAPYLAAPSVDEVHVVVGCRAAEVAAAIPPDPRIVIHRNLRWELGMAASIRCGVRALGAGLEALLLGLGDQPRVTPAVVERLVAAWRGARPRPPIIIPTVGGRRGHPMLFDARLAPALARLRGDAGARGVVARNAAALLEVPVRCAGVRLDVDTPADYQALAAGRVAGRGER